MGCYSVRCGLSGLQIADQESIIAVPIMFNKHNDPGYNIYAHSAWVPVGLPMECQYNDYGSIEIINEKKIPESMIFNTKLFGCATAKEMIDHFGNTRAIVRNHVDFNFVANDYKLPERKSFIGPELETIALAMFHKKVWNEAKKYVKTPNKYDNLGLIKKFINLIQYVEKIDPEFKGYFSSIHGYFSKIEKTHPEYMKNYVFNSDEMFCLGRMCSDSREDCHYALIMQLKYFIESFIYNSPSKVNDDNLECYLNCIEEIKLIDRFSRYTGFMWNPPISIGPQSPFDDESGAKQKKFNKFCIKFFDQLTKTRCS
jgi:hypothetical protein